MNPRRLAALTFVPTLVAATLLTGCAARSNPDPAPPDVLPQGGVDARVRTIILDDLYVEGAHGVPAGATAPLRLALTNEATADDSLVGVSSPVATQVELEQDGRAVEQIPLPAGQMTDLEFNTGVLVEGVHDPLQPGKWFPVTFRFAHAGTLTVQVTVGPLGHASAPTGDRSRIRRRLAERSASMLAARASGRVPAAESGSLATITGGATPPHLSPSRRSCARPAAW